MKKGGSQKCRFFSLPYRLWKGGQVHPLASGVDQVGKYASDINANALALMHGGEPTPPLHRSTRPPPGRGIEKKAY
jgi:hypothetical protein